jgi:predicted O-linked N-acetylglucosamine transferase (SPINDLY family)
MNTTPEQLYATGRLDEAQAACRQRLATHPTEHGAMHLLGIILCRQKRFGEGLPLLAESVSLNPGVADYRVNYGIALNEAERWRESEPVLRSVLSEIPDHALALLNLGNSLHSQGRSQDAVSLYRRSLELHPSYLDARVNLAVALKALGKHDQATAELQSTLGSEPRHPQALFEQGRMLADQRRYQEAEQVFRRLIGIDPSHHQAMYCLGIVLSDQGHWPQATEVYAEVVRMRPDLPEAYQAMAVTLRYCNRITESLVALEKALQLKPDFTLALQSYGSVLAEAGRIEEGIEVWRRSLQINPKQPDLRSNIVYTLSMVDGVTRADLWREHRAWAEHHAKQASEGIEPAKAPISTAVDRKKIRIGYISPDLRLHSVCYFLIPLLESHDKERFEIFCYSDVSNPDQTTSEIRRLSDQWRDVRGKPTAQVHRLIQEDQIDILIDLAGHTMGNRMELFGLRVAPMQASWLGYPETTGLPTVDFKIADRIVYPESENGKYSSERILRLPNGYHCYLAPPGCPDISDLPVRDNGYITFGSFSSLAKLTPATVALWSEVLKQVPDSKLLLKARQLADPTIRDRYCSMFAACGVPRSRLRLELAIAETTEHLGFYKEVDLALDTYPYNGTTTLCEGLWMGVPPVSLCGPVPASRVGSSLLHSLGLGDWVAQTPEEFVAIAKGKVQDVDGLATLRMGLRERFSQSTLGSAERFALEFESALVEAYSSL